MAEELVGALAVVLVVVVVGGMLLRSRRPPPDAPPRSTSTGAAPTGVVEQEPRARAAAPEPAAEALQPPAVEVARPGLRERLARSRDFIRARLSEALSGAPS